MELLWPYGLTEKTKPISNKSINEVSALLHHLLPATKISLTMDQEQCSQVAVAESFETMIKINLYFFKLFFFQVFCHSHRKAD